MPDVFYFGFRWFLIGTVFKEKHCQNNQCANQSEKSQSVPKHSCLTFVCGA